MHRYRIVAQITLILSIFNLVLAAPTAVNWQRIHEARGNSMVIPEVGPVPLEPFPPTPQHSSDGDEMMVEPEGAEAASDGPTPPQSAPASPQHSSDGAGADGMVVAEDAEAASDRPKSPQPSLASPQHSSDGAHADEMVVPEGAEAASDGTMSPHPSLPSPQHSLDGSESTLSGYPTPHLSEASSESGNSWMLERPPRLSTNGPASFQGFAPALQLTGSNRATTRPGGLVPPPTETPTDNAGSVDDIRYKKIRIATELGVAGGVIALIALAIQQNKEKQQTP
ncbi:hypothetical protein F5888DRAFT_844924 [Russula emetica]|nr:hypothetical protein F5888DRAFT_844924 [Russula emetica]